MNLPTSNEPETTPLTPAPYPMRRIRIGLGVTLAGLMTFLLGARPSLFGLDRSPVIGFVQIAVFSIGLALICIGGYLCLASLWHASDKSIAADFGLRMVSTGYVICVFAAMADIFGFGSQTYPELAYFGPLQALGVEIGQAVIALGFLLLLPWGRRKK